MKNFTRDPFTSVRFCVLAIFIIAVLVTACGGGGGGTTTVVTPVTPTVYTFSCWNGNITSTVAVTKNDCAVPVLPSLSVTGIAVTATFASGTVPISGTVTATAGSSSVQFILQPGGSVVTVGTLSYSTMYSWSGNVVYSNAPNQSAAGTFTTGVNPVAATCSPTTQTFVAGLNACAANSVGVYITSVNQLPVGCVNVGDTCYNASVANNTIKFMLSGVAGEAFALYRYSNGNYVAMPVKTVDGSPNHVSSLLASGGGDDFPIYFVGSANGITKKSTYNNLCYEWSYHEAPFNSYFNTAVSCPI